VDRSKTKRSERELAYIDFYGKSGTRLVLGKLAYQGGEAVLFKVEPLKEISTF
jgi:hypothetical protein